MNKKDWFKTVKLKLEKNYFPIYDPYNMVGTLYNIYIFQKNKIIRINTLSKSSRDGFIKRSGITWFYFFLWKQYCLPLDIICITYL